MESWHSDISSLTRALAPVFDERDDHDLIIEGELPAGLHGVFMRNGPNPQFEPDDHYLYPFDGTGMIHAVYLDNGRARYRNRWVLTQELAAERAAGQRLYNSGFAGPPNANLANTNIIHHGGRYLALYEAGQPYQMDRELNTLGPFDYDDKLPGVMSAHPKIDPVTGELLALQYDLTTGTLLYTRANKEGMLDRAVPFQSPWPAMVHDIALTERHVVAFICPLNFGASVDGAPAAWQPERGTMIALIPRDATAANEVTWIQGPPFFHWHVGAAFEQGSRIDVVIPWFDAFSFTTALTSRLELHRIVIDTGTKSVEDQTIDDRACEFGRINEAYLGRKTKYCYLALRSPRPGEAPQKGAFEALARYDLDSGLKTVYQFPAGVTAGEPVFVPDPQGKREEDGFIFTFAHEEGSAQGRLAILDARDMARGPIAHVRLPRRVPAGLHGSWIPA
ncbi:carotenoid oxygenase family protein [Parapusillimonas sp. SGNA-6]|nr:carotenoid oxygenase family protein [Parapusillimonas sp. SGNA-6]